MNINIQMSKDEWLDYCQRILKEIQRLVSQNIAFYDTQAGPVQTDLAKMLSGNLAKVLKRKRPKTRGEFNVFVSVTEHFLKLFEKSDTK